MVGKFVLGFFSRDDHADNPPNGQACKHANSGKKEKVNLCIGLHQLQYHSAAKEAGNDSHRMASPGKDSCQARSEEGSVATSGGRSFPSERSRVANRKKK